MKFFGVTLCQTIFEPILDVFWSLFQFFYSNFCSFGTGFDKLLTNQGRAADLFFVFDKIFKLFVSFRIYYRQFFWIILVFFGPIFHILSIF